MGLTIILLIICEYQVLSLVLNERKEKSKKTYGFIVLYVIIRTVLYKATQPPMQRLIIILSLFFIFNTIVFKDTIIKRILGVCLVIMFMIPFELIIIGVTQYLNLGSNEALSMITQMGIMLILIKCIQVIRPSVKNKKIRVKKRHKIYAIGFASIIFIYSTFFLLSGFDYNENVSIEGFELGYGHLGYFLTTTIIVGILLLINRRLMKLQDRQTKEKVYYQQKEGYRNQLKLIRANEKKLRQLKHDYRNHLSALRYIIEKEENEKAFNYINEMEDFLIVEDEYISTGEAIDSILNYKFQQAKERQISVALDVDVQEELRISEFDLTVVLGNLMDNAIEAIEKIEKMAPINLNIKIKKGAIGIHISNPYNGEIVLKDGLIKTSKEDSELHGNGLNHIREIVERYHGSLDIEYDNHEFNIKIIMYNN